MAVELEVYIHRVEEEHVYLYTNNKKIIMRFLFSSMLKRTKIKTYFVCIMSNLSTLFHSIRFSIRPYIFSLKKEKKKERNTLKQVTVSKERGFEGGLRSRLLGAP